jgi:hypothetical protein
MATVKTYDPLCYELACTFLADEAELNTDAAKHALALEIQQCVEDEIDLMRQELSGDADSDPDRRRA